MSYCRFSEADAYIYDDVRYGLYCCACSLRPYKMVYSTFLEMEMPNFEGFVAGYDYDAMLAHIAEHRINGDYVPEHVDEELKFERNCIHIYDDKQICEKCRRRETLPWNTTIK